MMKEPKPFDTERSVTEEHKIIVPLSTLKLFGVILWGLHFFARISDRDFAEPYVHNTSWFMVSNDILNIVFLFPLVGYGMSYRYFLDGKHIRMAFGVVKIWPRFALMAILLTCLSWSLDKLDLFICFWSPFGFPMDGFLSTLFGAILAGGIGPIIPIFAMYYADCFGIMAAMFLASLIAVVVAFLFRAILKYDVKMLVIFVLLLFGPMYYTPGWDVLHCNVGVVAGVLMAWLHTSIKPRLSRRHTLLLLAGSLFLLYFGYLMRLCNTLVGLYYHTTDGTRIYIYTAGVCGLIHIFMAHEGAINSMNLPERFWVDKIGMPMYFFQVTIFHSYGCWFMDDFAVTDEDNFLRIVGLMTTFNVVLVLGIAVHYMEKPWIVWLNKRSIVRKLNGDVGGCSHSHYPFHSECLED